ncbi:hypothetical protein V3C99_017747, partial [Haemonchus contortus]
MRLPHLTVHAKFPGRKTAEEPARPRGRDRRLGRVGLAFGRMELSLYPIVGERWWVCMEITSW